MFSSKLNLLANNHLIQFTTNRLFELKFTDMIVQMLEYKGWSTESCGYIAILLETLVR